MVFTIFVELACSTIKRQQHIVTGLVPCFINRTQNGLQTLLIALEVWGKAAFVTHRGWHILVVQDFLERMKYLCATT